MYDARSFAINLLIRQDTQGLRELANKIADEESAILAIASMTTSSGVKTTTPRSSVGGKASTRVVAINESIDVWSTCESGSLNVSVRDSLGSIDVQQTARQPSETM